MSAATLERPHYRLLVADDEPDLHEAYRRVFQEFLADGRNEAPSKLDELSAELFSDRPASSAALASDDCVIEDVSYHRQGEQAVAAVEAACAENRPFALAFIDMRMPPGIDGLETARRIRALDPDINILIVTGYSDHRPGEIARVVGSPDKLFYFMKPFEPSELQQLTAALTSRWRLERHLKSDLKQRIAELERANAELLDLRVAAEMSAARSAEDRDRLSSVLESTGDGVVVLDREWRITYANRRALPFAEGRKIIGESLWELFPEMVGSALEQNYRRAVAEQKPVSLEEYLPSLDKWFEVDAYPSADGLTVFFRDVSEARKARDELAYLAHHDHLTGLINRFGFGKMLDKALLRASEEAQTAVFYIDLDEFKDVNDTLGHPQGDAVLREATKRLRACTTGETVIARMGGDEFSVVVEGLRSREEAGDIAERIIESLRDPHSIEGQMVRIGASIGIVVCPSDGCDADQLLQKADIAVYAAKADGRGTYRFFDQAMAERISARQALKDDLGQALARDEMHLAFQPIIDFKTGRVGCFETLLRWTHPTRGPIPPASFIPIAEETGMIVEIGDWVLNQACREAVTWPRDIRLAVNLSPVQFRNRSLPLRVATALSQSGLPAQNLELEVTESVLLRDSEENLWLLHELRALGVAVALDDFGTGFSSLSYLHQFPFRKLKIDRSFIAGIVDRHDSQAIVHAAVSLGHALGITITAEGVETSEQVTALKEIGCDEAQGYFFGKPVGAKETHMIIEKQWPDADAGQSVLARTQFPRLATAS